MREYIDNLYLNTDKYNEKVVEQIRKNKGKINECLLDEIKVLIDSYDENEPYLPITFDYLIFLLAEFREKKLFPVLMDFIEKYDGLDNVIAGITDKLPSILVSVFDGNYDRINSLIFNKNVQGFIRAQVMMVYKYFYNNNNMISKKNFIKFLNKVIKYYDYNDEWMYDQVITLVSECHIFEMIEDVRALFEKNVANLEAIGDYSDFIDSIFNFESQGDVVDVITNIKEQMPWWAYFEECPTTNKKMSEYVSDIKNNLNSMSLDYSNVGRNDFCPCGSGKKYKKCCLDKVKNSVSYQNFIDKSLERYPKKTNNENDFYSYFKEEYIKIDELLYKALKRKEIPLSIKRDEKKELDMDYVYLKDAYFLIKDVVSKNKFKTLWDYDYEVSIHFGILSFFNRYSECILGKIRDGNIYYVEELKEVVDFFYDNFDLNDENESIFLDRKNACFVYSDKVSEAIEYFESRLKDSKDCKFFVYMNLFDDYYIYYKEASMKKMNELIDKETDKDLQKDLKHLVLDYCINIAE